MGGFVLEGEEGRREIWVGTAIFSRTKPTMP